MFWSAVRQAAPLVPVAAPSGIKAGCTAATKVAPGAAAAVAAASTIAAGSPATAAAIVLRPTTAIMAEAGVTSSHFPIRTVACCAAAVAAWPSVATVK
jgi:hypothetical protein